MTGVPHEEDRELERARALGDPTRLAIYRRIEAGDGEPVDVATLAELTRIHHTAVRQHLAKLMAAGLVVEAPLPPRGRGRPRLGYRAARPASPADAYAQLATLLAESVRTGASPREVGQAAGRRVPAGDDVMQALVDETTRLGFDPTVEGDDVVLRACPYAEVAAVDAATVCAVHLGLAEGIVDGRDGLRVTSLVPADPHTAGCRLHLERTDAEGEEPAAPVRRRAGRRRGTPPGG